MTPTPRLRPVPPGTGWPSGQLQLHYLLRRGLKPGDRLLIEHLGTVAPNWWRTTASSGTQ